MANARVFPWFRGFLSGAILSAMAIPAAVTIAQMYPVSYDDLLEVQGDIRGCRMVIPGSEAEVFDNTDLSRKPANRIGTLSGGQYVRLTGVFRKFDGNTAVQIYTYHQGNQTFESFGTVPQPVGWIDANRLRSCPQPSGGN